MPYNRLVALILVLTFMLPLAIAPAIAQTSSGLPAIFGVARPGAGKSSGSITIGSTTITGGVSGGELFQTSAGKVGSDSGFTYAGAGGVLTLTPAANTAQPFLITGGSTTGSGTSALGLSVVGTMNTSGLIDGAVLFANILNTASATGTLLVDLQVGSTSVFSVGKFGAIIAGMSGGSATSMQINGGTNAGGAGDVNTIAFNNSGSNSYKNQFTLQGAGTSRWSIANDLTGAKLENFIIYSNTSSTPVFLLDGVLKQSVIPSDWSYGLGATGSGGGAAVNGTDISLYRDAAASLFAIANKNAPTTAMVLRLYNTTDNVGTSVAPTNYERGVLDWAVTSNVLTVGTQNSGTGSVRNMQFVIGGTKKMDYGVTTAGTWTLQGNVNAPGLAALAANTTAYVCWTTATGALSEDSTTCLASLRRLKDNITPFAGATSKLIALIPSTFTWKKPLDRNQEGIQLGFIAEDVEQVDTKLASYSRDGTLHGWQEEGMIALLVRGFQEQQNEIEQLKRRVSR